MEQWTSDAHFEQLTSVWTRRDAVALALYVTVISLVAIWLTA